MKPPPFDYYAPKTVRGTIKLLQQYGEGAKVLAGGQSLMPLLNMRLAHPQVVVDITRLPGLDYIRQRNGKIALGALTRHRAVETSNLLNEKCPLLSRAAQDIGDIQVRNRGTFGGSIAHADPAAQFCAVVYTLDGEIVAKGPNGTRIIPAREFFVAALTPALHPDELVTEVRVPVLKGPGWSFRGIAPRQGDFVIAGVAVVVDTDVQGTCTQARIGMFGVGSTPLRARQAEEKLQGRRVEDQLVQEVAELASREAEPSSDWHASAEYRREMVKYLVESNLRAARAKLGRS
jgi:CO/xanthine dehydrogenase FAD-binding subunit